MQESIKKIAVSASLFVLIVGTVFWLYNRDPERRFGWLRNEIAHCPNCGSFFSNAIECYAEEHAGWFPKGGASPLDSLTQLLKYDNYVHVFTCHALAGGLNAYYQKTGTFSEDYCCYRYNEGLRSEDPDDLIVVYYFKPTRWTSNSSRGRILGRQVMTTSGWGWDFISEAEFQRRQAKTLRYLAGRQARAADVAEVQSALSLQFHAVKGAQGICHITGSIQNKGKDDADVRFLQDGMMEAWDFRSRSGHFLVKKGTSMVLKPGEVKVLPGRVELTVLDSESNGRVTQRFLSARSEGKRSSGYGGSQGEMDRKTFDSNYFVQGAVWLNVSMGSITNLDCVIKSEKLKYLLGDV